MPLKEFTSSSPNVGTNSNATIVVLYVEDEDLNWELAERALRDRYQMHRARNAREVFAFLERQTPQVILMDIQLTGSDLSGIEITQALLGRNRRRLPTYVKSPLDPSRVPPIVFCTAYQARYKREDLLAAGGTDTMYKPVDFTRLALMLSKIVSRNVQKNIDG